MAGPNDREDDDSEFEKESSLSEFASAVDEQLGASSAETPEEDK